MSFLQQPFVVLGPTSSRQAQQHGQHSTNKSHHLSRAYEVWYTPEDEAEYNRVGKATVAIVFLWDGFNQFVPTKKIPRTELF